MAAVFRVNDWARVVAGAMAGRAGCGGSLRFGSVTALSGGGNSGRSGPVRSLLVF
jgi:hypothetical protein